MILIFLSINVQVKRLGGAYGAKITLPTALASAATVAANKLRKPVRLWINMEDNMCMLGKRTPYLFDYQVTLLYFRFDYDNSASIPFMNTDLKFTLHYCF